MLYWATVRIYQTWQRFAIKLFARTATLFTKIFVAIDTDLKIRSTNNNVFQYQIYIFNINIGSMLLN